MMDSVSHLELQYKNVQLTGYLIQWRRAKPNGLGKGIKQTRKKLGVSRGSRREHRGFRGSQVPNFSLQGHILKYDVCTMERIHMGRPRCIHFITTSLLKSPSFDAYNIRLLFN